MSAAMFPSLPASMRRGLKIGTFDQPLGLRPEVVFAHNDGVSTILSMDDLVWKLPLFDDVYYSMQGQNVMLVDV